MLKKRGKTYIETYEVIKYHTKAKDITLFEDKVTSFLDNNRNIQKRTQLLIYMTFRQIKYNIFKVHGNDSDILKAIQRNKLENVHFLIENSFYNINDSNELMNLFSFCAKCNNKEVYDYLLSLHPHFQFSPIQEKPKDYEPDIFKACKEGKFSSVQWLLEKEHINKNVIKDKYHNDEPIHIAAQNGHLPIVQYLIEKQKVDKDIKGGYWKETSLHYACENGRLPIVEYLISKGANINVKDINGSTPLHYAAYFGATEIVEFLLAKGANKNVLDNKGKTPYDLAANAKIRFILK